MHPQTDPLRVLLEDDDPVHRSMAHAELGRRAVTRDQRAKAVKHFREALVLDPKNQASLQGLRELGEHTDPGMKHRSLGGWFKGLFAGASS